jgi:molybdenum cofactor cytidylyltransferase
VIAAVVLAAGESSRMGRPKLLLPYRGVTVLECVLRAVLDSPVDRTVVVLGFGRERIGRLLEPLPVEAVMNPDPGRGMLSSILTGLAALPDDPGAVFIVPGDHPDLTPAVFKALLDARAASGKGLIVPTREGRGGHPLLMDLAYRHEAGRLDPAAGLRALLLAHPDDVFRLPVEAGGILTDIDTPADYRKAAGREPATD